MMFTTSKGIRIAYYIQGQGQPLLLIRGYANSASMWYTQAPELSAWFEVITFDNRDTGNSERVETPYTVLDMAEDTIDLIEHLRLGPVNIFGVSMGGMMAQHLAISRPDLVKNLVLGCTTCHSGKGLTTDPEVKVLFATLPELSDEANVRRSLPVFFSPESLAQKETIDDYVRRSLAQRPPLETFARHSQAIAGFDLCGQVPRISAPTMIQHGSHDRLLPVFNAFQLKELLPGAELKVYEGLGHLYFMENAGACNRDIRDFIQKQGGSA
jgi:pimeloyl-ACP methyl ester carboxylesterase